MVKDLSIRGKILIGFGIIFFFIALFSTVSILSVRQINENSDFIEDIAYSHALYTPGEKNSEAQLKELQGLQSSSQITVIPIILTKKEEVARTLSVVVPAADAMYLTGSSVIGETVPIIDGAGMEL